MADEFTITKSFMHCRVLVDGVVSVKALQPFKHGEKVGQVFAKTQEIMFERHLMMRNIKVNLAAEAIKFFNETGWVIKRDKTVDI